MNRKVTQVVHTPYRRIHSEKHMYTYVHVYIHIYGIDEYLCIYIHKGTPLVSMNKMFLLIIYVIIVMT